MIPVQQKDLRSIVSSDPVAVRGVEFFSYREYDSRRDEIIQLMAHAAAAKSYIIIEVPTANCFLVFFVLLCVWYRRAISTSSLQSLLASYFLPLLTNNEY